MAFSADNRNGAGGVPWALKIRGIAKLVKFVCYIMFTRFIKFTTIRENENTAFACQVYNAGTGQGGAAG